MHRFLATALVLLALLAPPPAAGQAGKFDLEKTKTTLTGIINKVIQERGVPSVSIALVRGDSIVWAAAFGYANVRTKTAATPETYYSTGSTFKAATATAILQLVDQGKIGLDQPVNRYLGDDVQVQDRLQVDKAVTFRHILSHWSGLTAGANTKPIWGRQLPKSLDKMVATLYSVRAPEAKWEYNNYAYGMAGLLVEKISGMEYEKYVVENILKPLGVTTAHPVYPSAEMIELMALPYTPGGNSGGKPKPVDQVHFDVYPAGDLWLTAQEMARFLGAHLNGGMWQGKRILSEASVKLAHEPQFGGTYALGWSVAKDEKGHTILSHSGGIPGMSSYMAGDVDAKVGVYFMSNSGAPTAIGDAAIKLLRGEEWVPPAEKKAIAVDPKILDSYVGTYDLSGVPVVIARTGTGLVIRIEGQPEMALMAESPTRFFLSGAPVTIAFGTNAAGVVDRFELETSAEKQTAKKVK